MKCIRTLAFNGLVFAGLSCCLHAQEDSNVKNKIVVSIAALKISHVIKTSHDGTFDLMIKDIEKSSGVAHQYNVVPTARGAEMFFKHKVDCLLPAPSYLPFYKGYDVLFSEVYAVVTYQAFTLKDNAIINESSQLENKTIGVIRDIGSWDFQKRFNIEGSTFVKVNGLEALVGMLNQKHIDVAIHGKGFLRLNKKLGYPIPNYSPEHPLDIDKLSIVCHKNDANYRYIQTINPYIREIVNTGKIKHYRDKALSH